MGSNLVLKKSRLKQAIVSNIAARQKAFSNKRPFKRDEFSFLTGDQFDWQTVEVSDPLTFIAKRKINISLLIVSLLGILISLILMLYSWDDDSPMFVIWMTLLSLFIITDLLVLSQFFVRTNDFELQSQGINFGENKFVSYHELVYIHFRKVKKPNSTAEYLVFRFTNRAKKEIDISYFKVSKKELGEQIFGYLKSHALKEDAINDFRFSNQDHILDA